MHAEPSAEGVSAFETFLGTPLPDNPIAALQRVRSEAEAEVDRLLALLDALDGDADLEEGGDTEPELGFTRIGSGVAPFEHASIDDRELDDSESEPSLASPESLSAFTSQLGWARGNSADLEGDPKEDDEDGHDAELDLSDQEPDADSEPNGDETDFTAAPSPAYANALRQRRGKHRKPDRQAFGNVHPIEGRPITLIDPDGHAVRIISVR
jgi:hypothetical protein